MNDIVQIAYGQLLAVSGLREFMEMGGSVLTVIMLVALCMWTLIINRVLYVLFGLRGDLSTVAMEWNARSDRASWHARKIRQQLIGHIRIKATRSLGFIRTLIAVAPLLGLLGTVTGMVEVFDVMAITGSSNARAMAAGVSKATLPTMAGMVVALSGMYLIALLDRWANRAVRRTEDEVLSLEDSRT